MSGYLRLILWNFKHGGLEMILDIELILMSIYLSGISQGGQMTDTRLR